MKKILFLLILTWTGALLQAQEKWSLERCIEYALKHNIELHRQENFIHSKQTELLRRSAALMPRLNLSVGQEWNWGRSVDMQELVIIRNKVTQATALSASASLDLFTGFSREFERLAAKKSLEAARQDALQQEERLKIEVTRAYLELMLKRQMMLYAKENYNTMQKQRERTAQLVEAGSHPMSALHEMEAQLAADKSSMVEAECATRDASLALMHLMNLPYDKDFEAGDAFGEEVIREKVHVFTPSRIDDYVFRDPRMTAAKMRLTEQRHLLSAAKGAFLPTLRVTAAYATYYSSSSDEAFRKQLDENRNPSVGLSIVIPVFNGLQSVAGLRDGKDGVRAASLEVEAINKVIAEEIRSCIIESENCRQKFLSSEETLRAMKNLLDITEAKYEFGATTALDYLMARNNLFKATSEYLRAKWQYLFQIKLLEHYSL